MIGKLIKKFFGIKERTGIAEVLQATVVLSQYHKNRIYEVEKNIREANRSIGPRDIREEYIATCQRQIDNSREYIKIMKEYQKTIINMGSRAAKHDFSFLLGEARKIKNKE